MDFDRRPEVWWGNEVSNDPTARNMSDGKKAHPGGSGIFTLTLPPRRPVVPARDTEALAWLENPQQSIGNR
jgi:hypothetical protein